MQEAPRVKLSDEARATGLTLQREAFETYKMSCGLLQHRVFELLQEANLVIQQRILGVCPPPVDKLAYALRFPAGGKDCTRAGRIGVCTPAREQPGRLGRVSAATGQAALLRSCSACRYQGQAGHSGEGEGTAERASGCQQSPAAGQFHILPEAPVTV